MALPTAAHPAAPRRLLTALVGGAVLVLVWSQRSALSGAVSTLSGLDPRWLAVALLADLASKAAVAGVHQRLLRTAGTALPLRTVLATTYAGNAVSMTLPLAGAELSAAFTFRQYARRGASPAAAAWTLLVSGVAAATAFALLLVAGAAATGTVWGAVVGAGGALLAAVPGWVLVVVLRQPRARLRLQSLLGRLLARGRRRPGRAVRALQDLVDQFGALRLPVRGAAAVLALSLVNWLVDALCLAAAIGAVGAPVPWGGLLLAFLAAAGVSSFALTPGGLGTVDLALAAALVTAGLDAPQAVAATLVYRLVTLWLATTAGWVTYAHLSGCGRQRRGRVPSARATWPRPRAVPSAAGTTARLRRRAAGRVADRIGRRRAGALLAGTARGGSAAPRRPAPPRYPRRRSRR